MVSIACDNWHLFGDGDTEFQSLSGTLVLAVDDNADSLLLTSLILEECGVQVMTAASATEALELIKKCQPDLLISDIAMPGEDGYALIRKIRSLPPHLGGLLPAIALTAYVMDEDRTLALESGFQMHLTKPIDSTELLTAVVKLAEDFPPKKHALG
ncbi:MAG TPA: response regulator [Coleofasciculaceae cyanobacterium]|jgi:hypothetical protein